MSVFTRLVRFRRSLFGSGYKTFQTVLLLTIALSLISLINLAVEIKENKCSRKELKSEGFVEEESDDGLLGEEINKIKSFSHSSHREKKHKKEEKETHKEQHHERRRPAPPVEEPVARQEEPQLPVEVEQLPVEEPVIVEETEPVRRGQAPAKVPEPIEDDDDESLLKDPARMEKLIKGSGASKPKVQETRGLESLEPRLQKIVEQSTKRKVEYVTMTEPNCGCKKKIAVSLEKSNEQSLCSDMATKRGPGQRVDSISFWGSFFKHPNRAHRGLAANVYTIPEYYPGWIFRLYTDITPEKQPQDFEVLCNMTCSSDTMDLCLMPNIPVLGDSTDVVGQFWRFFPMMDPLVDVFVSRDADSKASHREAAAVYDWLDVNTTFHVMRDAPGHMGHKILAGMWGGDNRYKRHDMAKWGRDLMLAAKGLPKKPQKTFDQEQLDKILWPHIENDVVAHDAYGCLRNKDTRPWPTKRETTGWNFVGSHESINNIAWKECPIQCRHPDHKDDWYNC